MKREIRDREAYQKVVEAFQKQHGKALYQGATIADIVAKTALPLQTVREMVPLAADEYNARLEVTESGEIRYSFPHGFTSKYRGFRAGLRRMMEKVTKGVKIASAWVFKVWIMVMLVGYFVLFMLIALASLLISMAASSSSSESRSSNRGGGFGGLYLASGIFNMIIRIWFYSELLNSMDRSMGRMERRTRLASKPQSRPLYKAIFSFVFGDGDPNADWPNRERQAVIAYIQANRGVIALPEFMALTGLSAQAAEERICGYCAEFGGLPEATEEGTVVYRFDALLLRAEERDRSFPGLSAPIKRLKPFSSNPAKMNGWFSVINGVNLLFGGYFLFNALGTGAILTQAHFNAASRIYGITYLLLSQLFANPLPVITVGLGLTPLLFSLLFWLIPCLRYLGTRKDNEGIKMENLRKDGFNRIWNTPLAFKAADINPKAVECKPSKLDAAKERIIKELGVYSSPEVEIDQQGETVYSFGELERERRALERYRSGIDPNASHLGATIFDSGA
ncbi:MAG: hypothetical protein LBG76_03785 [Treponema sp.]|jgi:hypothetical protein|nr:hypothetical protein [Treponema sp.]